MNPDLPTLNSVAPKNLVTETPTPQIPQIEIKRADKPRYDVPIMIEITEEDRQNAESYCRTGGCLIWTALARMGHRPVSVSPYHVRLTSIDDIYRPGGSDDISPENLYFNGLAKVKPFYKPEVVGKQIILYPANT